jgi:uroporphyrinogen decarboxylase
MFDKEPDFKNFKNHLMLREKINFPIIELLVADEIKEKISGKRIINIKDEIYFQRKMGYDYINIPSGILKPTKTLDQMKGNDNKWADEDKGDIYSLRTFEEYQWPEAKDINYCDYKSADNYLPENMKIISQGGKIFTATWMLMGFNRFSFLFHDDFNLVKKVIEKVGEIQFEIFKHVIELENVEAYWVVDDIAYTEGLMLGRDFFLNHIFPWYKKMGDICKKKNIAYLFHSDGDLTEILDDLIECGFTALHPIEPKAMDIIEINNKYKEKLCLLGNIDLDLLIRAKPETIKDLVVKNLDGFKNSGFYIVGSSNSIPKEVPIENYIMMNKTALKPD